MKKHNSKDRSCAFQRSIDSPQNLTAEAVPATRARPGAEKGRSSLLKFFLAGVLFGVLPGRAVTLFDHNIPPTAFSDILNNPNDHWSWDLNTIHYKFDASFDTLFSDARIKGQ